MSLLRSGLSPEWGLDKRHDLVHVSVWLTHSLYSDSAQNSSLDAEGHVLRLLSLWGREERPPVLFIIHRTYGAVLQWLKTTRESPLS